MAGNVTIQNMTQRLLAEPVDVLNCVRHLPGKLEDPVYEERRSHFEQERHVRPIHLQRMSSGTQMAAQSNMRDSGKDNWLLTLQPAKLDRTSGDFRREGVVQARTFCSMRPPRNDTAILEREPESQPE